MSIEHCDARAGADSEEVVLGTPEATSNCWESVFGALDNVEEVGDFEDKAFEMSGEVKEGD
jgi:hypothetical protein